MHPHRQYILKIGIAPAILFEQQRANVISPLTTLEECDFWVRRSPGHRGMSYGLVIEFPNPNKDNPGSEPTFTIQYSIGPYFINHQPPYRVLVNKRDYDELLRMADEAAN